MSRCRRREGACLRGGERTHATIGGEEGREHAKPRLGMQVGVGQHASLLGPLKALIWFWIIDET
jgi:hypothetical protein